MSNNQKAVAIETLLRVEMIKGTTPWKQVMFLVTRVLNLEIKNWMLVRSVVQKLINEGLITRTSDHMVEEYEPISTIKAKSKDPKVHVLLENILSPEGEVAGGLVNDYKELIFSKENLVSKAGVAIYTSGFKDLPSWCKVLLGSIKNVCNLDQCLVKTEATGKAKITFKGEHAKRAMEFYVQLYRCTIIAHNAHPELGLDFFAGKVVTRFEAPRP
jgi:hypothetical protein